MRRRRYNDEPKAIHHAVGAGVMDALGRGFLIATAGLVLGAIVGTSHLAALGLWTFGVAGAAGMGLMIGSALVRNAGCERQEPESDEARQVREVMAIAASFPVVLEAEDVRLSDQPKLYVALLEQQRVEGTGTGRSM
jgi:hypothetical protein